MNTLKDNKNNIEQGSDSTTENTPVVDLQLLSKVLEVHLRTEVPSGELFKVKCAFQNRKLMVLVQHPVGVKCDRVKLFSVLETTLTGISNQTSRIVELYLRIGGEKIPYAKRSLTLSGWGVSSSQMQKYSQQAKKEISYPPPLSPPQSPPSPILSDEEDYFDAASVIIPVSAITVEDSVENTNESEPETLDPFVEQPEPPKAPVSRSPRSLSPVLLGVSIVGVTAAIGGSAYLATRPCVMFECQQLQTAKELHGSFPQLVRSAKKEPDLVNLQKRLDSSGTALKVIPSWSPSYPEVEVLVADFSKKSQNINRVVTTLQQATTTLELSRTPVISLEELQGRQQQWRGIIVQLEAIRKDNEVYSLVQPRLTVYRSQLQQLNKQLVVEEKILKNLAIAKNLAADAVKRESAAKSLQDWQKLESIWQQAVQKLGLIPKSSATYPQVQQLLSEYQTKLAAVRDRNSREKLSVKAYNQAVNMASKAKSYEQQNQWTAAMVHWQRALNSLKEVKSDSTYFKYSQSLINPYSLALNQAQARMHTASSLLALRSELDQVCTMKIKICNHNVNQQGITVRLTPAYEQTLQTTIQQASLESNPTEAFVSVNQHFKALQEALGAISDRANLPLVVYDAQGKTIQTRTYGR